MSKKEYVYYWYYHGAFTSTECRAIDEIIRKHDWETFCKIKEPYENIVDNDGYKIWFFPDRITVFDNEDEDYVDDIPLTKETFNLITETEHEHG